MTDQTASNTIETMVEEHDRLIQYLQSNGQISLQATVELAFAKTLLVSSASYYEHRMIEVIIGLYEYGNNSTVTLAEFVRNQAIGRRYAQLFDWNDGKASGANGFFRSFGVGFRDYMRQMVRDDRDLDESIRAFLELGKFRNDMVHNNYADFPLNKNVHDVYILHKNAGAFVEGFAGNIQTYMRIQNSDI